MQDDLTGWSQTSRIMDNLIRADPKATEDVHQERFWEAILKKPKKERDVIMRALARSFLSQRRTGVLRSMRSQAERDAERAEREAWYEKHRKSAQDGLDAVIERKVREILGEASH